MKDPNSELVIDQAKFHFRGKDLVGTVTIYSPHEQQALKETIYLIEKSLAKICFAYNAEQILAMWPSFGIDASFASAFEILLFKASKS